MSVAEVVFRRAAPEDASFWAATRQKAWVATYRGIYPDAWIDAYDFEAKAQKDRASLSNPDLTCWLVMDGQTCVGYFSYGPDKDNALYLKSLYLLPGYQGKGLGRRIMSLLREVCQKSEYTGLYNHCNVHNLAARAFYERMGGRLTGIDTGHANKAEDQCRYDYEL